MNNHRLIAKCQGGKPISHQILENNANFDKCFSLKGIYKLPDGQSKEKLEQHETNLTNWFLNLRKSHFRFKKSYYICFIS